MKILINVVNARNVGGGLQVVHNFLLGTQQFARPDVEWYYAVSECLDSKYLDEIFKTKANSHYHVFPNQPDFLHTYRRVQNELRQLENDINPDVIYTILGPCYNFFKNREVIRFVHPWVVTSNPYAWSTLPFKTKIRMKIHILLLKKLVRRIPFIVTQTEAVKQGLIKELGKNPEHIRVINNVLPAVYASLENTPIEEQTSWVEIPVVGGGGNLKQQDLAILYRSCKISFLPSVLEVFSASTIESMYFQLPTVATNLSFNTEVFADSCLYYTPKNFKGAASQIVKAVTDEKLRSELCDKMKKQLLRFNSFEKYFNDTVDFLIEVGSGKHQ